jgi:hypothetical protein
MARLAPPTAITSAASYWMPWHFTESAWTGHAPFAAWLMEAARPRSVVELGTHRGFSFFAFAEAASRLGLETRLSAIDTWVGDDQAGFYGEDIFQAVRRVAEQDYPDITRLLRETFAEAVDEFADGEIDLLHIDGRHGYADVREDFEEYVPKLSSRAVVLFHDTQEHQEDFGVYRFWDEVRGSAPSFEFWHSHGLGVLLVGSEVPDRVREFVSFATEHPERTRELYAELGQAVTERSELEVELNLMLNSKSWRITAPLRSLRRSTTELTDRRAAAKPSRQHPAS